MIIWNTAYFTVIQWSMTLCFITIEYAVSRKKMPHVPDCAISVISPGNWLLFPVWGKNVLCHRALRAWQLYWFPYLMLEISSSKMHISANRTQFSCIVSIKLLKASKSLGSILTAHNWQNWKRVFLTCPCHEIYKDEAVGLNSCKYTWKITIYVNMWNLGQFRESLIFCQ